jgi:hypothetical protein
VNDAFAEIPDVSRHLAGIGVTVSFEVLPRQSHWRFMRYCSVDPGRAPRSPSLAKARCLQARHKTQSGYWRCVSGQARLSFRW